MITLRGLPLRRPVVVSRKAPHFPGRGGHRPLRLLVIRTNSRCTCQKVTTNHRGGTRALPPAMPAPPLADHLTIALSASGHSRIRRYAAALPTTRRSLGRNRKGTAPAVAWSTVPERNRSSCGHQNSQEPVDPE